MKRRIYIFALAVLLSVSFASCAPDYRFQAIYPDGYTAKYFYDNYVQADPNLIHLYAAENDAGKYEYCGRYWRYYAIKDVSVDEYVCYSEDHSMLDPSFQSYIARNKSLNVSDAEILSYGIKGAELYWRSNSYFRDASDKMEALGANVYYERIASIDALAFQNHLRTHIIGGNYELKPQLAPVYINKPFVDHEHVKSQLTLNIRVYFSDYENIVWDGAVVTLNGEEDMYYVKYQMFTVTDDVPEGFYKSVYVPLDESVSKLISDIDLQEE